MPPLHGGDLHGGDLATARQLFGDGDWLDLSTGINPRSYPVPAIPAAIWARLPQRDLEEAVERAARDYYALPDRIGLVAAPGTQALIQWLPDLTAPGPVAIVGPTYGEHALAWTRAGYQIRPVPDLAALGPEQIGDILHAVVVNPNNPDGRRWRPEELAAVAERLAARGGLLVVDESFADVTPELSAVTLAERHGLVVLRSFGKFFGLAGVRLGFLIATPKLALAVQQRLGPWAVSGPALAIAATALSDRAWIDATRTRLAGDVIRLDAVLSAAGLTIVGGTDLFRLARHPQAGALYNQLARRHILIRQYPDQPQWLRFGVPDAPEAFARLAAALTVAVHGAGTPGLTVAPEEPRG
ncbi:MAG: threonine-phosphate decarboxylase CobD [Azospirillaceae bacterium]|nr:threonine-phosphate decarboxylase CobD [Azospirillaceae bacterium]